MNQTTEGNDIVKIEIGIKNRKGTSSKETDFMYIHLYNAQMSALS